MIFTAGSSGLTGSKASTALWRVLRRGLFWCSRVRIRPTLVSPSVWYIPALMAATAPAPRAHARTVRGRESLADAFTSLSSNRPGSRRRTQILPSPGAPAGPGKTPSSTPDSSDVQAVELDTLLAGARTPGGSPGPGDAMTSAASTGASRPERCTEAV